MCRRGHLILAALGCAASLAGCYEGRTPPQVTLMRVIEGGSFRMGPGSYGLACGDTPEPTKEPEIKRCDVGEDVKAVIAQLSWAPPVRVVKLPRFEMDEHEVTNAQYEYCEYNGVCSALSTEEVAGVQYYGNPDYADYPVVNVTRAQAMTYCTFLNRALPSEAQWERAARLGTLDKAKGTYEMRKYPWAEDIPSVCQRGVQRYAVALGCGDMPMKVKYSRYSKGDHTKHGIWDVASNVSEWVRDRWHQDAYCKGRKRSKCKVGDADCAVTCASIPICEAGTYSENVEGTAGVIRGGDYKHSRCFHRLFVRRKATGASPFIGFRCAR